MKKVGFGRLFFAFYFSWLNSKGLFVFLFDCTHLKTYIRTAIPREHTRKIHKIIWVAGAQCHESGYPATCLHFYSRSPNNRRSIRGHGNRSCCCRIHWNILANRHRTSPHTKKKPHARTPQWGFLHLCNSWHRIHGGNVPCCSRHCKILRSPTTNCCAQMDKP